jgi:putative oxidoreductase
MTVSRIAAWLAVPARWYLGGLFVLACLHKIADPASFALDVATYELLPLSLVNLTAIVLPWWELAAGTMLLAGFRVRTGAALVAGMMLLFLGALLVALARGLDMSCGCFASQGAAADPISWLTVVRDLTWLALSGFVLACDRGLLGVDALFPRRSADA